MVSVEEFKQAQTDSLRAMKEFFSDKAFIRYFLVFILFTLPRPFYNEIFTYNELLESKLRAISMASIGFIQVFLYAVCTLIMFRVLDKKDQKLDSAIAQELPLSRSLFFSLLLLTMSVWFVFEALHGTARLVNGMSYWGRLFQGPRIFVLVGDVFELLLRLDFLCFGGWLVVYFYLIRDPDVLLKQAFHLNFKLLGRFLLAWGYSWGIIIPIPITWFLLWIVWKVAAVVLIHVWSVPVEVFTEGTGKIIYTYSYKLTAYMVSLPLIIRVQYFRLFVAKEALKKSKDSAVLSSLPA